MDIETPAKRKSSPRKDRMAFVQFRVPMSTRRAIDKICKDAGMSRSMFFRAVVQATLRGDVTVRAAVNGEVA